MANRLKLKWGDKEIDMQETADRLVGWITKFKEVGDIAVQYDPVHAALPWAGVRFILLVRSLDTVVTLISLTFKLARCWGSREIGGGYCWNGAGCRVNWSLCHIRTAISN